MRTLFIISRVCMREEDTGGQGGQEITRRRRFLRGIGMSAPGVCAKNDAKMYRARPILEKGFSFALSNI